MKYIKQFFIILVIAFIGELLHFFLPLQIPSAIYGMVILFVALLLRIVRVDSVRETAYFLIEIMPVMFVPAGVGMIRSFDIVRPLIVQLLLIIVVSTILVMVVSGRITQMFVHRTDRKSHHIYVDESGSEKKYLSEGEM